VFTKQSEIILKSVTTPKQLLNSMRKIKYDTEGSDEDYSIRSPKQLLKDKKGICYDQTELERMVLQRNGYNFKTFFAYDFPKSGEAHTHTFLVYKDDKSGSYYWFENSWGPYHGIHGPYRSYEFAIKYVTAKLKASGWKTCVIKEYSKPTIKGLNIPQFASHALQS